MEKSGSASGTGVKQASIDAKGERRRVRRRRERWGSHLSPGHSAPMEGGHTAGIRRIRSELPGGTTGDVCGVSRESCYEM